MLFMCIYTNACDGFDMKEPLNKDALPETQRLIISQDSTYNLQMWLKKVI